MRAILSIVLVAVSLVGASLAAVACGTAGVVTPGDADAIAVVASFYPLAYVAERVGGDAVRVTNLTPPGVEPHDLELTPRDVEAIAEADVVVYLGGGFQPAVEEAVTAEAGGVEVDAASEIQESLLPPESGDVPEGDPEELVADPHLWLDPVLYARVVDQVASALGEVASSDARTFLARAEQLDEDLTALDRELNRGLAECETRVMITNHAAFGYLAAAYDLEQRAISGVSPESEPDPARIAALVQQARADRVTTIFTEDLVSPEVAETLASEAGLETAVLSPLEGLTEEQVAMGDDYLTVMRENLETLRDGLVCV